MSAHLASLINAICLIGLGLWGYFSSESPSPTAFIPVGIGVALLLCYPGIKKENKIVAHIAVVLTFVVLLGLIMPLRGALGRGDSMAVVRVSVMLLSTVLALAYFVKSFIDARKNRAS